MEAARNDAACLQRNVEEYIGGLVMLVPTYVEGGGDMTTIVQVNGATGLDPRPLPVVLKSIARYFGVDVTAVRERYGDILGKKLNLPLPLSPQLVLVPFKMRTPRVAKDGTYGYVSLAAIDQVVPLPCPTRSRLDLKGEASVRLLQSSEFAVQQLRNARIVQMYYRERMNGQGSEGISLAKPYHPGQTDSVVRYF